MKNIKIAICGIKGAGKSHLLNELEVLYKDLVVIIRGSETMVKLAQKRNINIQNKEELKDLTSDQRQMLREDFLDYLETKEDKIVLVDGHYSFLTTDIKSKESKFEIAMHDRDFEVYDIILLLDADKEEISHRLKKHHKDYHNITLHQLQEWFEYELNGLMTQCEKHDKIFSVIKNNTNTDKQDIINFIQTIKNNPEDIAPSVMFDCFYKKYKNDIKNKTIVLVDCDGTLGFNSAIKEFYKNQEMQKYMIDDAFFGRKFYGLFQFFRLTQKRLEIPHEKFIKICKETAQNIQLNFNLIQALESKDFFIIALTSGIRAIWNEVFLQNNINFVLLANTRHSTIAQDTKAYFAKKLKVLQYNTIAIGDDVVDFKMAQHVNKFLLMQNANIGEILNPYRHKIEILSHTKHNIQSQLKATILSQKYPLQDLIEQSRFQKNAAKLREIHKQFGYFLAREILSIQPQINEKNPVSSAKCAIIGILRAGAFISEGILNEITNAEYHLLKEPQEEVLKNLKHKQVILTDSVINTGKTIFEFLNLIDKSNTIYVATNVIYKPTLQRLSQYNVHIFCIRVSENTYIGQGKNDTGNRLFNEFSS